MTIILNRTVAPDSAASEADVRILKKALNRIGLYIPDEAVGITGIPDTRLFKAIRIFQGQHNLPATGRIRPDDPTLAALNTRLERAPGGTYRWRIVEDGKARPAHAQFNRTLRQWNDSPDPGEDYNCRCWAEPVQSSIDDIVDPPIVPVYPLETAIATIIPILRVPKILRAVHELKQVREHNEITWLLGKHKSEIRWKNQLETRRWTSDQITQTLKYGKKYSAPNKVNPSNTATRYEYKGRFVVRDDQTKEILQISGKNDFKANIGN
jgi:Colicin E5 ribonuclease domain/Putative peptidoglycan binding domain